MNETPAPATPAESFILAGKTDDGVWQRIETASLEEGESAEDVKTFLQTMAHAHSRNFVEMDILTEAQFVQRGGPPGMIAA